MNVIVECPVFRDDDEHYPTLNYITVADLIARPNIRDYIMVGKGDDELQLTVANVWIGQKIITARAEPMRDDDIDETLRAAGFVPSAEFDFDAL